MPGHYYEYSKSSSRTPVSMKEEKYGKYEVEEAARSMDEYDKIMKDKKMQGFIKKYRTHQLKEAQASVKNLELHAKVGKKMKGVFSGA